MIGVPDEDRGQIVQVHIVLKDGVAASPDTVKRLQDHVKATIAPFKYSRSVNSPIRCRKRQTGKI